MRAVPRPARPGRRPGLTARPLAAALVAAAVLAGACRGGADRLSEEVARPAPTTATSTQPAARAPTPSSAPAVPAEPAELAPGPTAPAVADAPAPPPAPAAVQPAAPLPGPVGSLARTYLGADGPGALLVEVRAQDGAGPRSDVVARIATVLGDVSGKPVAVRAEPLAGGPRPWTSDELRALADGGLPQTPERAVLRLLFLQGDFAANDRAVGVAVRGDVAAVFAQRVDEAAGSFGDPAAVEDAVAMHEVGHLLGLVDLVLATGRQDPEHPGHSPNRGSVMYHAVESTLLGTILQGGPPRDFDAADLADLERIRRG